jgi:YVTN family beta-propeller protein
MQARTLIGTALVSAALLLQCGGEPPGVSRPGTQPDGSILLPNSWTLTPAGEQIPVGDLPLGMALTPDDAYLLVTNNGYADQYVSVIDLGQRREVQKLELPRSWLGLTFNAQGDKLFVSGGASDLVEVYGFDAGRATHERTLSVKSPEDETDYFVAGLAVTRDGSALIACALRQNRIFVFDLVGAGDPQSIEVGEFPYSVAIHPDDRTAYVSNWGGRSISVVDLVGNAETDRIAVGSHPNAMALSPEGARLYVTNANSNDLSIIDTAARKVEEVVDLSPYPGAPRGGATPNGLALSSDGGTLYLASADNNSVTQIDVSLSPAAILGSIPTGWYPTAVALTSDDRTLLVANGKGLSSKPNVKAPQPELTSSNEFEYIGQLFPGTVSVVEVPDAAQLASYTKQVKSNNGFEGMEEKIREGEGGVAARAIPRRVGEPSLIKYVFYIIKENRTYDQVLGDLPQGEGDSSLTLFGREVTPNHHALAETYVLFDNLYVDAEVSADGHEWSVAAIATDFVEKLWPTNYSDRGFPFVGVGFFPVAYPDAGYLWDAAARSGVTYRSYGEFVLLGDEGLYTLVEGLKGHFSPTYPTLNLDWRTRDIDRAAAFIEEFSRFADEGTVPRLNIIQLPNDHTAGTLPGRPTPRAMVADNDLGLARIIEAISRSPIWEEAAVFVVEDDSQSGPDHIDAHRTVSLVASPYARRGYVDHTMYDTVSILRTIELILGIPPMSQYDAAAIPMFNAFHEVPDFSPYVALPNLVPLDELNTEDSFGAELSKKMNFAELDAAPEDLLNEIIWKSIKGADSEMPRPHTNRVWIDLDDAGT